MADNQRSRKTLISILLVILISLLAISIMYLFDFNSRKNIPTNLSSNGTIIKIPNSTNNATINNVTLNITNNFQNKTNVIIISDKLVIADGIVTNIWIDGKTDLDRIRRNGIRYLYVDIGGTDSFGIIDTPKEQISDFLKLIDAYEKETGYDFITLAYSEINTRNYKLTEEFLDNMEMDYVQLVEDGFDGTLVDIEPVTANQYDMYEEYLKGLDEKFPKDALITVYAGNILEKGQTDDFNDYMWQYSLYERTAEYADIIVLQGFDLGLDTTAQFKDYLIDQIRIIDSGNWKCKFMIGIPTHNEFPETIENGMSNYYNIKYSGGAKEFIGVSVFAEWTMNDLEWKVYSGYKNKETTG